MKKQVKTLFLLSYDSTRRRRYYTFTSVCIISEYFVLIARKYGNKLNLTVDEIDSIVTKGKELGVYFYIYTGGEPLVRKKDLLEIARRHPDCEFMTFTNGTLIDNGFADELLRVKNIIPVLSVEGFEESTDARRGSGTFAKVVQAMDILREKKLPFGISCCYTSNNLDSISSDEYVDQMVK